MDNLKAAQQAKANKSLNIKMRYPEGIMTRREWLKYWQVKGAFVDIGQKPRIEYSRTKYNRLTGKEQEEYERKCDEKVTSYRLHIPGSTSFYDITKTEYDHFNALQLSEDIQTEKHDLSNRIAAGIATEEEINEDAQRDIDFCAKYFKNK